MGVWNVGTYDSGKVKGVNWTKKWVVKRRAKGREKKKTPDED